MQIARTYALLIGIALFLIPYILKAQSLKYGVYRGDSRIGTTLVNLQKKDNQIEITTTSNSAFTVLFMDNELYTENLSIYSEGFLLSSIDHQELNGEVRSHTEISWKQDQYRALLEGKEKNLDFKAIQWAFNLLYHHEPKDVKEVFSERLAVMCPLEDLGNHSYLLTLPDGRENFYRYEDGICVESEIRTWLATIKIKLE